MKQLRNAAAVCVRGRRVYAGGYASVRPAAIRGFTQRSKKVIINAGLMIRLDTFDWQGQDFYRALGYETVGQYENAEDGFSEYFFLKRL